MIKHPDDDLNTGRPNAEQRIAARKKIEKEADDIKVKGNQAYFNKRYEEAITLYTKAIKLNPKNAIYYANRSMCRMKIDKLGLAFTDADRAIKLNPNYAKGYYQKGLAQMGLGKWKEAKKLFIKVKKIGNFIKEANQKIKECDKAIKEERFQKALENKKVYSKLVDLSSMKVPKTYVGPRLPDDGRITQEFVDELIEHYKAQADLHPKYVYQILLNIINYYKIMPNILEISIPKDEHLSVCGDVFGQFHDVVNLWSLNGMPSEENPYLYLGNYVNHGHFSVEVIVTFFALKLLYPNHFHLLRGNYECKVMNKLHGFEVDVKNKVDRKHSYEVFEEAFNLLPLCGVIKKKVFVCHGGLFSNDDVTLHQIKMLKRNRQPQDSGLMCDLLWSNPQKENGRNPGRHHNKGILFGPDVTKKFLDQNKLDLVVRSNELKMNGYESQHGGKCITVFTAPNYSYRANRGGLVRFDSSLKPVLTSFDPAPAPPPKRKEFGSNSNLI